MSKRRLTMLIVISSLFLSSGSYSPQPEIEVVAAPTVEPESSWHDLYYEYQLKILHDIRKEHLVKRTEIDEVLAERIVSSLEEESDRNGLDPNRVLALIIVESAANPSAVSPVGALGLMQVMPRTGRYIARKRGFKWSGVGELRIVESNISYGTWYYSHLIEQFDGDRNAATAAYNWGPGTIRDRIREDKKLPEVYPGKVYAAEKELQGVIWNEYQSRFWRGVDQYIRDARQREYAARSERRCDARELRRSDEQSVCLRNGTPVPASPGDLSGRDGYADRQ